MVRAILDFVRLDLPTRTLIIVMTPIVAIGGGMLWLLDRHSSQSAVDQARHSVSLVAPHIARSLRQHDPVHEILPASPDITIKSVDALGFDTPDQDLVPVDLARESIASWRRDDALVGRMVQTSLGPVYQAIIPVDRPISPSDYDTPTVIVRDDLVLEQLALVQVALPSNGGAWSELHQQMASLCLLAAGLALVLGRSFARRSVVLPLEELRCRLGDTLSEERTLMTTPLIVRAGREIGALSEDLETFRQTLVSDIRDAHEAICETRDAQHAHEDESHIRNAIDDARLQAEQMHHALGRIENATRELDTHTSSLRTQAHRLESLASSLDQSSTPAAADATDEPNIDSSDLTPLADRVIDLSELLDELGTNLSLAIVNEHATEALSEFVESATSLQDEMRCTARQIHERLASLGQSDSLQPSYALEQTVERLANASKALASTADGVIATYRALDGELPSTHRSLQVIQSRLEHLESMHRSSDKRMSATQHRLEKALHTFGRYTLAHKDAA